LSYPLLPRDTRDESFHLVFTGVSEVVGFSIAANVKDDFGSIRQNRTAGIWGKYSHLVAKIRHDIVIGEGKVGTVK